RGLGERHGAADAGERQEGQGEHGHGDADADAADPQVAQVHVMRGIEARSGAQCLPGFFLICLSFGYRITVSNLVLIDQELYEFNSL
uniref:Uncharacterized protein n=2 Tax=Aegilops tauschii TaxID=37682 RepID=A0A453EA77_AEGTS